MKSISFRLLFLVSVFNSTYLYASETLHRYIGLGIGTSYTDTKEDSSVEKNEEYDTSYKLFIGYKYNKYMSFELSYLNAGQTVSRDYDGDIATLSFANIGVGTKLSYPLFKYFSPNVSVGLHRMRFEYKDVTRSGRVYNTDFVDTSFFKGIGFNIPLKSNISISAEYDLYDTGLKAFNNSYHYYDIKNISIIYNF